MKVTAITGHILQSEVDRCVAPAREGRSRFQFRNILERARCASR